MDDNNKPKHMYEKSDWDKISVFHMLHRKITGIPLHDSLLYLYGTVFLLTIVFGFFIKK